MGVVGVGHTCRGGDGKSRWTGGLGLKSMPRPGLYHLKTGGWAGGGGEVGGWRGVELIDSLNNLPMG